MIKGMIFDIQPFSIYDGPGIRTVVFLKGCNLRCGWCHNPESWEMKPQLQYNKEKCIDCMSCIQHCPNAAHRYERGEHQLDWSRCTGCGKCAAACFSGALLIVGQEMSVCQVMERVCEDALYYQNSGGGVTVSGGEPLLQVDFVSALLRCCIEKGIHTAIDTAGLISTTVIERVMPYTNLFLFDLKAADRKKHRSLTGVENRKIYENLQFLSQAGARIWIRVPCIGGANLDQLTDIAKSLNGIHVERVELLAYHAMGQSKLEALGLSPKPFFTPSEQEMSAAKAIFTALNIPVVYRV